MSTLLLDSGKKQNSMDISSRNKTGNRSSLAFYTLYLLFIVIISGQAYAAESITFYHNDILGSPVATTDENGNICWREDYQPYGDKLKNNDGYEPSTAGCGLDDNQRGYTGHVHDKDIGLTYMQARYYDPIVGRFMGIDPVGVRLDNQVSFNRYAYGNNNPYKFVDPDGKSGLLVFGRALVGYGLISTAERTAFNMALHATGKIIGGLLIGTTITEKVVDPMLNEKDEKRRRSFTDEEAEAIKDKTRDENGDIHCDYCGTKTTNEYGHPNSLELDHEIPYAGDGETSVANGVPACRSCNRRKGKKTREEFEESENNRSDNGGGDKNSNAKSDQIDG